MKYLLSLIFTITITAAGFAQDSIRYRVIFISDAGKMTAEQQKIFQHAADNVLEKGTTVFYLDNNQYLQGKIEADSKEGRAARNILRSQYNPMRAKGASVYFIAANAAWNKLGSEKKDIDSLLKT